jgi:hypothetical protein
MATLTEFFFNDDTYFEGGIHNVEPEKKTYSIYIKSHDERPDYEDSCEAGGKKEAVKYFLGRIGRNSEDYWDESMIEGKVVEEN